ncbi:hypothetical protein FOXG_14065 [Fusarium oxysporum f. sp. lycopersici 4287]|uniref:Chromo domain-containing protein n=2 Tax=Fusarium oxysporum TaxID=5507 RepID=A0A0J9VSP5_FUSO4|nr:hypothetical protein FOXG_12473 [Fusarium oxysporum f. sp. lycopersici 4287]XP_018253613.1 hypothetical protein FOXG_14065 [Fusarium oxysporum f. sp. lycopersici 4287]EWZ78175.1 hypothetical protein FOWG_17506 [Fusarium oxysporum f. sp. lycopersici MN25]KAJ9413017.1 hypothetical protein QL093DRAFT_1129319 [Fusarium oxysporum]KNB13776.1 hypothetical protein FOXG_12473 [Fusarium oxysporum f. sp. lycopersici 4287]KNB15568.1 hypothetical protein FOXG_14065 [Fusarium oxysporum f. sp. lycopersici
MAQPKTGGRSGRNTRSATAAANAGIEKLPAGRVGAKANKAGDSPEDQPKNVEDVDMDEAPPINEPTESVSDSPAQTNGPSQANSASTESTPANDNGPPDDDDPDEVVPLTKSPNIHSLTEQMEKTRIEQKDEECLAIVTVQGGNKRKIVGFGPRKLRDYAMVRWKSRDKLMNYTMTEDEKKLEVHPIEWKERRSRGDEMIALGGVAMVEDISLLIPKDGQSWPPPSIRILVKWKKRGEDETTTSWETPEVVKKAWCPNLKPPIKPGEAELNSTRKSGRICKNDKAVTILKDIPVGLQVLKKGQQITNLQYAVIDAAVRCRKRYNDSSASKDEGGIADRHATPDLTRNDNRDSTPKAALDTVVKVEGAR